MSYIAPAGHYPPYPGGGYVEHPMMDPHMGHGSIYGGMGPGSMYSGMGPPVDPGYMPPTIARTSSYYPPSASYAASMYDHPEYDDYHYDDRYGRSYDRRSRSRSRSRYYDDARYDDYDRDYRSRRHDDYYDDRYGDYYGSRSRSYYPSRSYSSRSSRRGSSGHMAIVHTRSGDVKVLHNGSERISDRVRRLLGLDPKGVSVMDLKKGDRVAAHIRKY